MQRLYRSLRQPRLSDYYTPPVLDDRSVLDDRTLEYYRRRVLERIAMFPERRSAILNALREFRRTKHVDMALSNAGIRLEPDLYRNNRRDPDLRNIEIQIERMTTQNFIAMADAMNALLDILYTDEERALMANTSPLDIDYPRVDLFAFNQDYDHSENDSESETEETEEFIPVPIPPVVIEEHCDSDINSSGKYVSSLSLDELQPDATVKLSDGHCYAFQDIVDYYKSKVASRREFTSPFTREPFTRQDIQWVRTIQQQLEQESTA